MAASADLLAQLPAQIPYSLAELEAEEKRRKRSKYATMFPAEGPFRRELYKKHLEFFKAGATYNERAFIAGNRTGKTTAGAYETTLHLTGLYPEWWEGKRFSRGISAWVAGGTNKAVRDILQFELLGPVHDQGSGMIPGDLIVNVATARGVAGAIDSVYVRHVSGELSTLGFKSYAEGRENFQGTSKELVWVDEEPPIDVYRELLMRTMVVKGGGSGIVMLTFTPLLGWSEVVDSFLGDKTA
jgi:phage terminase large subunit-like protein